MTSLTTIGFDADDTLWQNEHFYRLTLARFAGLLGEYATPEAIARAKRSVPLGHHAQAEDIGDVAVFLLGDDARHVTGVTLPVEGGTTIA